MSYHLDLALVNALEAIVGIKPPPMADRPQTTQDFVRRLEAVRVRALELWEPSRPRIHQPPRPESDVQV